MASPPRSIERCKRLKIRRKSLTQDGGCKARLDPLLGGLWDRPITDQVWAQTPCLQPHQQAGDPIHDQLISLGPRSSAVGSWARFSHSIGQIVGSFLAIWRRNGSAPKSSWPVMEEGSQFSHLPLSLSLVLSSLSHQCSKHTAASSLEMDILALFFHWLTCLFIFTLTMMSEFFLIVQLPPRRLLLPPPRRLLLPFLT